MSAQTAKITPGPWELRGPGIFTNSTAETAGAYIVCKGSNTRPNAAFVFDALNVYQETGLTPRQLADQRAELLEALRQIVTRYVELVNSGDCGSWNPEKELEVVDARSAIQRATGEQP